MRELGKPLEMRGSGDPLPPFCLPASGHRGFGAANSSSSGVAHILKVKDIFAHPGIDFYDGLYMCPESHSSVLNN